MSTSVSDLASLLAVAAALSDRVANDLLADNRELQSLRAFKRRLDAEGSSWIVRITGLNGTPDYATGTRRLLLSKVLEGDAEDFISLDFQEGAATCPFEALSECCLVLTPGGRPSG